MSHDDDTCPHLVRANLLEAENARLKAEVERLTKAGDAMASEIIDCYRAEGYDPINSNPLKNWNAAKEGNGQP